MKRFASPAAVAAACALIVVANLSILGAVAWNRQGEPRATLALTERELALPAARQDDGTDLALSLRTTHEQPGHVRRTANWKRYELPSVDWGWLDRAKLLELGFRLDVEASDPDAAGIYARTMPRRAYVVVEYDGEAWERWIRGREEQLLRLRRDVAEGLAGPGELADAEALFEIDRTMRSRLFPVDAGTDADALRRRYGDRDKHAVLAGLLLPTVVESESGAILSGEVLSLVVNRVHVSRELSPPIEEFLPEESWREIEARERGQARSGWPPPAPPRYEATLAIGHRHEPWLVRLVTLELTKEAAK